MPKYRNITDQPLHLMHAGVTVDPDSVVELDHGDDLILHDTLWELVPEATSRKKGDD